MTVVYKNFYSTGDAWKVFTPAITGVTLGNGTLTGRYKVSGKTVNFRIFFEMGSSSAITGGIGLGLPVPANMDAYDTADSIIAQASLRVGSLYEGGLRINTSSLGALLRRTGDTYSTTSSTAPGTWATGDTITIVGSYEAA